MEVFVLALVLIAIAIAGFAIKMFFRPGARFTKTCGSNFHPRTGKPMPCSCASQEPEECDSSKVKGNQPISG
jgi:hypothetical protein